MIDHVVLFRWRPESGLAAREAAMQGVAGLVDVVAGITRYVAGGQTSPEGLGHGMDFGFIITFESAAARDAYLPHPEHQRVVRALIQPILAEAIVFDIAHGTG